MSRMITVYKVDALGQLTPTLIPASEVEAYRPIALPTGMERVGACDQAYGRCCNIYSFRKAIGATIVFPGTKDNGECIHLEWKNGLAVCGIYETRPDLCCVFPEHPIVKSLIPEYGYSFIMPERTRS